MDTQTIWAVAGSIIVSVGGAGVIICAVSGYVSAQIAKRLDAKYEQRLNKELEQFKSSLDHKRYVTKAQFDREFDIYHALSKTYYSVVRHLVSFAEGYYDPILRSHAKHNQYETAVRKTLESMTNIMKEAQDSLYENVAFIPKEIFELYDAIFVESTQLFRIYADRILQLINTESALSDIVTDADLKTTRRLKSDFEKLNEKLREYLASLSVIE